MEAVKPFAVCISLFALGFALGELSHKTSAESTCRLVSRNFPETFIQISGIKDSSYYSGTLVHKGEEIRQLWFTQSHGYGSKWWGYGKDGTQYEGRGGGSLLEFRGNHPVRSLSHLDDLNAVKQNLRQFILVGLGGDLYYTQERTDDRYKFPRRENGFELIKAAEGYFVAEGRCEEFLNR